ncbi:50S ribosomal protein L25/general stress protein Ctc [Sinisalibacter aestuarii]|uniref:50S ribosomal protein L25/general stress protein Ctc n=1 Tax=Sinisalibacter aestuarii TaxID=2949426 RepID=UPI002492082A|nr:50S ribosomal protein L25/general stress protein Ctc [Sinisalibacter aestuarii]
MAREIPDFHATVRTGTGKGAARQARREGLVPGIVYGGESDPLPINIPFNVLLKKLKEGRFLSTLFNLKVDGHDDVRVICRAVERDIVKDLPTHVDFMRLHRNTRINIFIHVEFINEETAPGIKKGGVLVVTRPDVELSVIAGDIPEKIVVDLAGRNVGDVIHISDVTLPDGVKPTIERNFIIASISAPSGLRGADEETDETPETEVIGESEE